MNDIVPVENGAPVARLPSLSSGGRPMAIIPQTMDDAYRLGKAICLAGMAPKGMDTPEKCMIAIMRGMEVGLTPMQALDKIAIVNGRPTIWGDGALGLVRGSGLCEYVKEWIDGEGDNMVAYCEAKRRGEADPVRRSFSVKDAKDAGLWGKAGPWQQFKKRMLAMRARAFCLRDLFADVLGGLYLKEELDNEEDREAPRRAPSAVSADRPMAPSFEVVADQAPRETPERPAQARRAPSSVAPQPEKRETPPAASAEPKQATSLLVGGHDPEKVRKTFDDAAKKATDLAALNDAWMAIVDPIYDDIPEGHPDRSDLDRLFRLHRARVDGEEGAMP